MQEVSGQTVAVEIVRRSEAGPMSIHPDARQARSYAFRRDIIAIVAHAVRTRRYRWIELRARVPTPYIETPWPE